MKFGIFDHLDDAGVPHGELFAGRLGSPKLTTAPAFTPITSPSITARRSAARRRPDCSLAALAQRTTKLRFGPLVYLLPFYHPLRLIEEVCMLDQMSGGRLELGVGRGVSPFETANYALDFAQTQRCITKHFRCCSRASRRTS